MVVCYVFLFFSSANATQNTPFRGLVLGNIRVRVYVIAVLVVWPPHKCQVKDRARVEIGVRVRVRVRVRVSGDGLCTATRTPTARLRHCSLGAR